MVGSTWNCIQCFEIWAGAQLEPVFGGSATRFKFLFWPEVLAMFLCCSSANITLPWYSLLLIENNLTGHTMRILRKNSSLQAQLVPLPSLQTQTPVSLKKLLIIFFWWIPLILNIFVYILWFGNNCFLC